MHAFIEKNVYLLFLSASVLMLAIGYTFAGTAVVNALFFAYFIGGFVMSIIMCFHSRSWGRSFLFHGLVTSPMVYYGNVIADLHAGFGSPPDNIFYDPTSLFLLIVFSLASNVLIAWRGIILRKWDHMGY